MDARIYTLKAGEGAYTVAAVSGLITGVAAGTATAGHLFAARWSPTVGAKTQFLMLQRFRARWQTVTGFTGAQEVGLDLSIARAYTASHTGGTAVTLTGDNQNNRTAFPASAVTSMRVATTGALTAGTHTLDAQPIRALSLNELADAATVQKNGGEILLSSTDLDRYPIVLAKDEGLVLRNLIAMGAAGTARVVVEMDWLEVARY